MENSRDSSVWRSLAVALGDGLAFGVGMALTQKAARRETAPRPEIAAAGERLQELERRMALLENAPVRLDPKVLETIVGVFEADLRERDEQWGRRLSAAIESATATLRQEHAEAMSALRQDVVADLRTLESQGIAWQQEITETVPRLMEEKIAARLDANTIDAIVERKTEGYRIELAVREREIAELRERLTASEQRTLDLLTAIGQACRETAERMSPQSIQAEPAPESTDGRAVAENVQPAEGAPRFEVQTAPKWNLPMVSSLLVAVSGCFVCLHWL